MHRVDTLIDQLKQRAETAAGYSHSPYSRFRVGAALITENGEIYQGCNVENASFGLTQCAERSALTAAVSNGVTPGTIKALLIYTPGETAHPPCGACRQVMQELMAEDSLVISCCDSEDRKSWTGPEYLPDPFVPESLFR